MNNKKKFTIIILHGWKLYGAKYNALKKILESKGYKVFAPDLPGFGNNILQEELNLEDYTLFLKDYIFKHKIKDYLLIGHSFGGRVIVCFLNKYKNNPDLKGIILSGTPLLKHSFTIRKKIGVFLSKTGKIMMNVLPSSLINNPDILRKIVYKIIGEWDYYKAGNLTATFKNIVMYPLEDKLSLINLPTLILWGADDRITPLKDAFKINKLIKGSKLVVVEKTTHKLPYEQPLKFANEVLEFLKTI